MRKIKAWAIKSKSSQYVWKDNFQIGDPLKFAFFRTRKDALAFAESKRLDSGKVEKVFIRIDQP